MRSTVFRPIETADQVETAARRIAANPRRSVFWPRGADPYVKMTDGERLALLTPERYLDLCREYPALPDMPLGGR
jgi:hypothetical protein